MSMNSTLRLILSLCCAAWAAMDNANVLASSVAPMTIQQMADHAGQVIVGTVSSANAYWSDEHHRIETELVLRDVEYLKGRLETSDDSFRLVIPGGTIGEKIMSICCAPAPQVGQKWMFFLLPTYHSFPVVGIYSGAFRIQADAQGVERVYREVHGVLRGVTGIDDSGFIRTEQSQPAKASEKLVAAHRMRVVNSPANLRSPAVTSLAEFRELIAPTLAASKDHALAQPAGAYIASPRSVTTLKTKSPGSATGERNTKVQRTGVVKETIRPRGSKASIDQP